MLVFSSDMRIWLFGTASC